MQFYTKEFPKKTYPCIVLYKNDWNDFGYIITYEIFYEKQFGDQFYLGDAKFLSKNNKTTTLPTSFTKLDYTIISLGTSLEYYQGLKSEFDFNTIRKILIALNDIGYIPELRTNFQDLEGYKNAMLRFSSTELVLDKVFNYIENNQLDIESLNSFIYSIKLPAADDSHVVNFNFNKKLIEESFEETEFPFRINAIIGKNGTGKTQFLASMVKSLAGIENTKGFEPSIPLFNKVIAISYSLFDNFPKPSENSAFSYNYIGFRTTEVNTISDNELDEKLKNNLTKIIKLGRANVFYNLLGDIIDLKNLNITSKDSLNEDWLEKFEFSTTKRLSSGQSILFFIFTELIAEILPKTFILFDEPETHLHPEATSILIESLYSILTEYDSYAILSTHSPYLLQNIPSEYINVFQRIGNTPNVVKLHIETFGNDVTEISNQVYNVINVKDFYKKVFDKIPLFQQDHWSC